ncbi:hypothetical protein QBC44DRAFT_273715 [Cladorrhinum sp. PSN332]|nr:hypothetical protein QBC44DRAFT_273715 [Cladorrhinum sp. PSN332]
MPVTVRPHAEKIPNPWRKGVTTNPADVLAKAGFKSSDINPDGISKSSFDARETPITPTLHGLVDTAIEAWNNHHHLVLRPDDFWLSILCQLGFFITAHAEDLRSVFVSHQGQKDLVVEQIATFETANYGMFAQQMAAEIGKNVKDPDIVGWALPDFSTTTDTDRVAGAVLLMGAMQQYFKYFFDCCCCGIPSLTLLGDKADWELLARKVEGIANVFARKNGVKSDCVDEVGEFVRLLKPLTRHMVLSFDEPQSEAVRGFWGKIASKETPMADSGGPAVVISGWITTFCFWTTKGKKNLPDPRGDSEYENSYYVDEVQYLPLDENFAVVGYTSVPVTVRELDDSGVPTSTRSCKMVAGLLASRPATLEELVPVVLDGSDSPAKETKDCEALEENPEGKKKTKASKWKKLKDLLKGGLAEPSAKGKGPEPGPELEPEPEPEPKEPVVKERRPPGRQRYMAPQDTTRDAGAPPVEQGLSAVQPQAGWMIFELPKA